jgi:hypothetical protein
MTHHLIAALSRQGHWQLTEADAKIYATAVKNVARHYSLAATQKSLDWYALGLCMASMEGTRILGSYQNARARRTSSSSPRPATATVYPFPGPSASPPPPSAAQPPPPAPSSTTPSPQPDGVGLEGFTGDGIDGPIGGSA